MTTPNDEDDEMGLRELRVDPPGGQAFQAALHRRLVAAGPPPAQSFTARLREAFARRPALVWPTVGVLCGVLAFTALRRLDGPGPVVRTEPAPVVPSGEVAPTYQVPSSKVAVIKLNFAATVDVADVSFEVELPEGLHFWSGGQKLADRIFRWPGELRAGDNLIPVAVRGDRAGLYRVKARAVAAGETVEHEVVLDVKGGA
jgi:hypothetical protein